MLPLALVRALETEVAACGGRGIAKAAAELSRRYREGEPRADGRFATTSDDIRAYAAFRMPATYEAVAAALTEVSYGLPGWAPGTLLDVGAGPGTATWAATTLWPEIDRCTLVERESEMISLGKRLAAHAEPEALRQANWIRADLNQTPFLPDAELVIAAYVLGELDESSQDALVSRLWSKAAGVLLLIEPGTPAGFTRIRRAREGLVDAGARVVAPCPHEGVCPLAGSDWCHFGARVERSRLHRQVKEGELSYEDEKFSYVAVSMEPAGPIHGRVIRRPKVHKGHVELVLCAPEGLRQQIVTRKEKERFRWARKVRWGGAWRGEAAGRDNGDGAQ